jgi:hypothetical protein
MKRILLLFAVLMFLLLPVMASADNVLPPSWAGTGNTLHAVWDDWSGYNPPNTVIFPDVDGYSSNPSGIFPPYIYGDGFGVIGVGGDPASIIFETTTLDLPVLILKADNFDNNNPEKWIRVQMTFGYGRDAQIQSTIPPAWKIETLAYRQALPNHPDMVFSAWDIFIKPNPFNETINFVFPAMPDGGCNIILDQLVLDTKCVVPIPGSLLLLGSGIIGLVGIGMRKKS